MTQSDRDPETANVETASHPPSGDDHLEQEVQAYKRANRRRVLVVVGLAAALTLSFILGHWHSAYRAVVLDADGDRMFIAFEKKPPEWVDGRLTEPGNIVAKEPWHWNPEPARVGIDDDELVALYQRYTKSYTGTVVELRPAVKSGSFPMAIIQTDDGGREYVSLVDTVLLGVELQRRVVKKPGEWDPVLLPKEVGKVQVAPPPSPEPSKPVLPTTEPD